MRIAGVILGILGLGRRCPGGAAVEAKAEPEEDAGAALLETLGWHLGDEDCTGALDCWLKGIEFVIPDISEKGIKVGPLKYDLKLSGLRCHGVQLGGIASAHWPDASLDANVTDVGTTCDQGKWSLKGVVSYHGTLSVTISKVNMEVDMAVNPNEDGLPWETDLRRCGVSSIDVSYHFGDSALGWVLDLFEAQITPKIEKGIKDSVCGFAEKMLDDKVTPLLQTQLDPWILELIGHGPSALPDLPDGMLDWGDSHLVTLVNKLADLVESHINGVVERLSNGTGSFALPLNMTKVVPIDNPSAGSLGNVTLVFHQLSVSGVDTFTDVELLRPSPNSSVVLDSAVRMGRLDADLLVTVLVDEAQGALSGQGLNETFAVSLAARNLGVVASLAAAVQKDRVMNLLIGEALQVGCLLGAVEYLSITSLELELELDLVSILEDNAAPLEEDIDALVNNALQFLTEDYHDLVTAMAVGAAQGPLRDLLNQLLADAIAGLGADSACVPPSQDELFIDWTNSSLVAKASEFLNERLGPEGLNAVVDQLTPSAPGEASLRLPSPFGFFSGATAAAFGLDTFRSFELLVPQPDYRIHNELAMDSLGFRLAWPPLGNAPDGPLANMSFSLAELALSLDLLLKVDYDKVMNQRVGEVLDLLLWRNVSQNAACLFDTVDKLEFGPTSATVGDAHFVFEGKEVGKDIVDIVEVALNGVLAEGSKVVNDVVALMIDDAAFVCAGEPIPYPEVCPFPLPVEAPCNAGILECLLRENILDLPPLHLSWQGIDLDVAGVRCQSLDRLAFSSRLQDDGSLHLDLGDVGFGCWGSWSYRLPGAEAETPGDFCASLNHTALAFDVAMGASQLLPDYLEVVNCEVAEVDFSMEFAGGGAAGFALNAARHLLNVGVAKLLQTGVCMTATSLLNPKLSALIQNEVDPQLQKLLNEAPMAVPVLPGMVAWDALPVLDRLGQIADEAFQPDAACLGVNGIASWLTNGTGEVDLPLGGITVALPVTVMGQDIKVVLHEMKVFGLDTFTNFTFLNPGANPNVLHSVVSLGDLRSELRVGLVTEGASIVSSEDLRVEASFQDVTMMADVWFAVNAATLGGLHLDQAAHMGCLLTSVAALNVSSLALDFAAVDMSAATLSPVTPAQASLVDLGNHVLGFLLAEAWRPLLDDLMTGYAQGPLRRSIDDMLTSQLAALRDAHPVCGGHVADASLPHLDFASSEILKVVNTIVNEELGAEGLNQAMDCLTEGTGNVTAAFDLATLGWDEVVRVTLFGLTSFYALDVVDPLAGGPQVLENVVALGGVEQPDRPYGLRVAGGRAAGVGPASALAMEAGILVEVPGVATLGIAARQLAVLLDLRLEVNQTRLQELTVAQLADPYCVASTLDAAAVDDADLGLETLLLDVLHEGKWSSTNVTDALYNAMDTWTTRGARQGMNQLLAAQLAVAGDYCVHGVPPDTVPNEGPSGEGFMIAGVCVVAAIALGFVLYANFRMDDPAGLGRCLPMLAGAGGGGGASAGGPRGPWLLAEESDPEASEEFHEAFAARDEAKDGAEGVNPYTAEAAVRNARSKLREVLSPALVHHPAVPRVLRVAIPLLLVLNIGLFIWSNVSNGASVLLTVHAEDQLEYTSEPLFSFTLANTVHDMWEARVYVLALVVALFSGCWPYVKLLLLLAAWTLPPRRLSNGARERLLCYLDALGKWSLVDCYVLVLMMVAFRFSLEAGAGTADAGLDVIVKPEWGFYGFLLGTIASLVLGHLTVFCHRHASQRPRLPLGGQRTSMGTHIYAHPRAAAWRLRFARRGRWLVAAGLVVTAVMVLAGALMTCFSFEFQGLTGLILGADAKQAYSLVSTGAAVPSASGHPDNAGVRWIQVSFFTFALAMPLALLALVLLLWVLPLGARVQRQLFVLAEVLNAWSALDVFVLAVVAALVEISQFAQFIIGDRCDGINAVLHEYLSAVIPGDDVCFDVITTLEGGCWWIFTASLINMGAVWPLMRLFHRIQEDRIEAEGVAADEDLGLEEALLSPEERAAKRRGQRPMQEVFGPRATGVLVALQILEEFEVMEDVGPGGATGAEGAREDGDLLGGDRDAGRTTDLTDDFDDGYRSEASSDGGGDALYD